MNNVIREIDGFYSNNAYFGNTDSAYIHKITGPRWLITGSLASY